MKINGITKHKQECVALVLFLISFILIRGYVLLISNLTIKCITVVMFLAIGVYGYFSKDSNKISDFFVVTLVAVLGLFLFLDRIVYLGFGFHFYEIFGDVIAILLNTNHDEVFSFFALFKSKRFYPTLLYIIIPIAYSLVLNTVNKHYKLGGSVRKYSFGTILLTCFLLIIIPGFPLRDMFAEVPKYIEDTKINRSYVAQKETFKWNAISNVSGKSTVFIVLGETTRGDHLSLNGYSRKTTPNLDKENITSFSNAISIGYHTLVATPYMLTRKQVDAAWINKLVPETSIITAFKEAGYKTYYISYLGKVHIGDNAINQIVNEADVYVRRPDDNEGNADSLGLPIINDILQKDKSEKKLIVYKLVGSHYNFQDRYPMMFDLFKPSFKTVAFRGPNKEQENIFVNTYDNTILHTDYVVSSVINMLKNEEGDASLSFISDHGVSIYESGDGVYLTPKKANFNIACFFWMNESVRARLADSKLKIFSSNKAKPIDATYFVDTVMELAGLETDKKIGKSLFKEVGDEDNRITILGNKIVKYTEIEN